MAANDVPAVRPISELEQAVDAGGRAITFWQELPSHRPGIITDLAHLLRRQHTLPVPTDIDLGHLDPFVRLAERIQEAGLDPEARAWLVNRLDLLRGAWVDLPAGMSDAVIHGDAWPGNVAVLDDGTALLLDFECTSVGPPEWEVTSTAVSRGTFGELAEADYRALCRAYGDADVQCWSRYPVLPDARELSLVCFALQSACQHPHAGQ